MYSCNDGKMSFIVNGFAVDLILEFKLPVVSELKANAIALFPINPSFISNSIFTKSSEGILSGHPP